MVVEVVVVAVAAKARSCSDYEVQADHKGTLGKENIQYERHYQTR